MKENLVFPAGLKAILDHHHPDPLQRITLANGVYAFFVQDTFEPETEQADESLDTTTYPAGAQALAWDGTWVTFGGVCDADNPFEVLATSIVYAINGEQVEVQLSSNLDFSGTLGAVNSAGTTTPGYIVLFVELSGAGAGDHDQRFPLACFKASWAPSSGDTYQFIPDPIAVAKLRC